MTKSKCTRKLSFKTESHLSQSGLRLFGGVCKKPHIGWEELKHVYHCFIHIDIKDGKIWIQRNMTEDDLAQDLIEMGVAKEDIVLGLHPPYKRPLTGDGVA